MHLIRQRHPQHRVVADLWKVFEVSAFTGDPRLVGICVDRVRAPLDDRGDPGPEAARDPREQRPATAVLDRVVQHRGDRLILIAATLKHQAGDHQQMGHVRDLGAGAAQAAVNLLSHRNGGEKALRQRRCGFVHDGTRSITGCCASAAGGARAPVDHCALMRIGALTVLRTCERERRSLDGAPPESHRVAPLRLGMWHPLTSFGEQTG